ncbi:MAG: leucine-rich repeat domain-containing protein [Verrucomicrobiota bacterium]
MKYAVKLLTLRLLLMIPTVLSAQYTCLTNNGTITITQYNGLEGMVIIPSFIHGIIVTDIGHAAFGSSTGLTSVTIPESVTNIGVEAFGDCPNLTAITVDVRNSVYASVAGVLFNQNLTTLIQCPGGKAGNYTIPASVTSIGEDGFGDCSSLTSVTIPNSVTNIGAEAFGDCPSLTAITVDASNTIYSSVEGILFNLNQTTLIQYPGGKAGSYPIPASVTSIGEAAFYECVGLTSVAIGNGVTNIGEDAFGACPRLMTITVDALNSVYGSAAGVLFNQNRTTLIQCPGGKAGSYTIPDSVTRIGFSAFRYCTALTDITIADSATSIGDSAFAFCTGLTRVTIPNYITNLEDEAFSSCTNLTSVTIGNSVRNLGSYTFAFCPRLTDIRIPNSVTNLGSWAFDSCVNLTRCTISSRLTNISDGVFNNCTSLKELCFQGNAPSCGLSVFDGVTNVTVYYLADTADWGATFSGHPTALWKPQVVTMDGNFGVRTNQFGFNVLWADGRTLIMEASTNLVNPAWVPVYTDTLTSGSSYFSDPQWTNHPGRFYRLRAP